MYRTTSPISGKTGFNVSSVGKSFSVSNTIARGGFGHSGSSGS